MTDAASAEVMAALHSCRCCLRRAPDKDLTTPYTHLGNTEIYLDMIRECFNIRLNEGGEECGICSACLGRLRDASAFKLQVQRSQAELQARLERALQAMEEPDLKSETTNYAESVDPSNEEPRVKAEMVEGDGASGDFVLREEPPVKSELVEGGKTSDSLMLHEEFTIKSELKEEDGTSDDDMLYEEPGVRPEVAEHAASDACAPQASYNWQQARGGGHRDHTYAKTECPPAAVCGADMAGANAEPALAMACSARLVRLRGDEAPHASQTCLATSRHGPGLASRMKDMPGDTAGLRAEEQAFTCDTCEFCSKTFAHRSGLRQHRRIHSSAKLYACDICKKQFTQKCYMNSHIRLLHTGRKSYTCEICRKSFAFSSDLRRHQLNHTTEKPYACNTCKKQFKQKRHLDRHLRTHTGERPYACDVCSKPFAHNASVKRHRQQAHPPCDIVTRHLHLQVI